MKTTVTLNGASERVLLSLSLSSALAGDLTGALAHSSLTLHVQHYIHLMDIQQ